MSIQATTSFRTKTALKAAVARMVEDSSTAGGLLINDFIDAGLEHAMTMADMPPMVRWHDSAVSSLSGASYIHTPKHVREILRIVNTTTPFPLNSDSAGGLGLWTAFDGGLTGEAEVIAWVGDYGINTTIAAGSSLEIVSSDSDTRTVTVRGILNGEYATVTATLNGTTAVALSSTWDDVFQVYASAATSDRTISLRLADDTVIGTIGPGELDAIYHRIRLSQSASAAAAYRIIYRASPQPLGSDSDHIQPGGLGVYLYHWATAMFFEKRRQGALAEHHFALATNYLNGLCMEWARQRRDVAVPYQNNWKPGAVLVIG